MNRCCLALAMVLALPAPICAQSMLPVLFPSHMEGVNGTNANRLPFVFRARLSGLRPRSVYRYINLVVTAADPVTTNGAGNCIFVPPDGDFVRTSNPGLSTAGAFGELTTDASGEYVGWFVTEPTGNVRFTPGGFVFMRIALNDGQGGSTVALRLTSADSVHVVRLDTTAGGGTGLRGAGMGTPRDFVFLYSDTAGNDRPLAGSFVESDGTDNSTPNGYAAFYGGRVNGVAGCFGTVVSNTLPAGIRRIECRSRAHGEVLAAGTDADGVWPGGVNTEDPRGGTTELVLNMPIVAAVVERDGRDPVALKCWRDPGDGGSRFGFRIVDFGMVGLAVYDLLGREVAVLVHEPQAPGQYIVRYDAGRLSSGTYICRLHTANVVRTVRFSIVR
jgi:hypothetical protein